MSKYVNITTQKRKLPIKSLVATAEFHVNTALPSEAFYFVPCETSFKQHANVLLRPRGKMVAFRFH